MEYQSYVTDANYNVKQELQQVYQQRTCGSGETCWFGDPQADTSPAHDPQLCQTLTTLDNEQSGVLYNFDQFNNVTDKWEYGYGSAPLIKASCPTSHTAYYRHTNTQYLGGSYTSPSTGTNLVSLPTQVTIDQGGTVYAKTTYGYDESPVYNAPNVVHHDNTNYGGNGLRGNLTTRSSWINTKNSNATEKLGYDIAGNLVTYSDPLSQSTGFDYSDASNTYAHPTTITNAAGQSTQASYDYSTGKIISFTDLNSVGTGYVYNDPLDRLTQIRQAVGGGPNQDRHTNYAYNSPTNVTEYDSQIAGYDIPTVRSYDGLGRQVETANYEDPSHYIATTQSYDAVGRVASTSNPSRPGDGLNFATTVSLRSPGRLTSATAPGGAVTTLSYAGNAATNTTVVISTDPAGKVRNLNYDSLGRLLFVTEDPRWSQLHDQLQLRSAGQSAYGDAGFANAHFQLRFSRQADQRGEPGERNGFLSLLRQRQPAAADR